MKEEILTKKEDTLKKDEEKDYSLFKRVEETSKKQKEAIRDMEEREEKPKRKKGVIIGILIAVIIVVAVAISTVFSIFTASNEKIVSGVSISGIDISGLSKEEAKGKLEAVYNEKKEKEIEVKYQEYETTLNPQIMEVNYEIDKAVDEAYSIGRKENIFISNYDILFTLIGKKNIDVDMTLNEEITKQAINDIGVKLPGIVLDSSYSVEDDELIISKDGSI